MKDSQSSEQIGQPPCNHDSMTPCPPECRDAKEEWRRTAARELAAMQRTPTEGDQAFEALTDRVTESMRLEKLSDRELVFEVAHSEAADDPAVEEMMHRLWPDWSEAECPPDCWACKQEMRRG